MFRYQTEENRKQSSSHEKFHELLFDSCSTASITFIPGVNTEQHTSQWVKWKKKKMATRWQMLVGHQPVQRDDHWFADVLPFEIIPWRHLQGSTLSHILNCVLHMENTSLFMLEHQCRTQCESTSELAVFFRVVFIEE